MKQNIIILLIIIALGNSAEAQWLERGSQEGEFYFPTIWHINNTGMVYIMLVKSEDYGRTLTKSNVIGIQDYQGNIPAWWIFPDAADDTLYMNYGTTLRISYDDGETWEDQNTEIEFGTRYTTGAIKGEIYSQKSGIQYSSDFGVSFNTINPDFTDGHIKVGFGNIKVGFEQGSLFVLNTASATVLHSNDYGSNFETYPLPSEAAGDETEISRGASPGELYLMSWFGPTHMKVFRSTNYGETYTMQYDRLSTDYIFWRRHYMSGGRVQGEFYYIDVEEWAEGYYYRLNIYHSADYAQTFTRYVHDLREDYDGSPTSVSYSINVILHPEEGGTVQGGGWHGEGEEINLTAIPNDGYDFVNWTEGGNEVSEESTLSFTADSTRTLKANFQLINSIANPEFASISIYPNPTKGIITLNFQQFYNYNDVLFEVLSIDGRKLLSKHIQSELSTHDISNLPTGMYLYRFTDGGLIIKTGKIIIR